MLIFGFGSNTRVLNATVALFFGGGGGRVGTWEEAVGTRVLVECLTCPKQMTLWFPLFGAYCLVMAPKAQKAISPFVSGSLKGASEVFLAFRS